MKNKMSEVKQNAKTDVFQLERHYLERHLLTLRNYFFRGCFLWFVVWQISFAEDSSPRTNDAWSNPQNPVVKLWEGTRLDLWSLKSPTRPFVPWFQEDTWSRNSIDAFIRSKQISLGLIPIREADKVSLIRRATFDLTGLPPTIKEIQEFLSDDAADAYDKVIERLLASHDYGKRWAQHWLDIVRYADTNGFERDEFIPDRWRYRNYVIQSFNADLPYDEFICQQIAGDELAIANPRHPHRSDFRIATAFLRLGPYDTAKSNFDTREAARDEMLVDLTNTTGSAFFGQTFSCCRCHDHKSEPLLQADHYRLRAFFAAIEFEDMVIDDFDTESAVADHNAKIEQKLGPLRETRQEALRAARSIRIQEVTAEFPPEVQQFVKIPLEKRDAIVRARLQPFLNKLDIDDEECIVHLTENEKKTYEQADAEIQKLESEIRPFTTFAGIKEITDAIPTTCILSGGDYLDPKEEVQPGIPSMYRPEGARIGDVDTKISSGRRTALAGWMTSRDNPWTARVLVNRLWKHHFGRGIVATPDDFGYSGSGPTHPELLDWLAIEFVEKGWSIKHMHRLMMLSSTYRQSSMIERPTPTIDSANQFLWRQNIRRMDAETLRDALLSISGLLRSGDVDSPLWPPIPDEVIRAQPGIFESTSRLQGYYASPESSVDVRSIFLVHKRSLPLPFLKAFNMADASGTCGRREESDVPTQALSLLNNDLAVRASMAFAEGLLARNPTSKEEQIMEAFLTAVGRPPSNEELQILMQGRKKRTSVFKSTDAEDSLELPSEQLPLAELCRALFNSNAFLFID